jgi:hypothetical protein
MILSFHKETKEEDDFNDSLKIDTINEIEELLSKQSKYIFN